ncbi:rhodanese-like domain-containing protein [Tropicimonas sediminicola]|uniref:Rhodanese-related sulfurtransferase n=1 Tax=Tropicimonas sediminicola TaxID=1031541 RepID=A0A239C6F6_9RHOB|nr:rhodanese-like domain-containing protein [Tropicimonas sediminicola]SNS15855.1 Rhodanese-related sulfurtransferase [Tropicimonas sediminicola]
MLLTLLNPFGAKAEPLDGAAAVSMVKAGKAVLLDVREPSELEQGGRARGAINVPISALERRADPDSPHCEPALKRGAPVILYCASGARSGMAGKVLRKLGHQTVYDLGPITAWSAAGGRLDR